MQTFPLTVVTADFSTHYKSFSKPYDTTIVSAIVITLRATQYDSIKSSVCQAFLATVATTIEATIFVSILATLYRAVITAFFATVIAALLSTIIKSD